MFLSILLSSCVYNLSSRTRGAYKILPADAEIIADLGNGWVVFELKLDDKGKRNCFLFHRSKYIGFDDSREREALTELSDCHDYASYDDDDYYQ